MLAYRHGKQAGLDPKRDDKLKAYLVRPDPLNLAGLLDHLFEKSQRRNVAGRDDAPFKLYMSHKETLETPI